MSERKPPSLLQRLKRHYLLTPREKKLADQYRRLGAAWPRRPRQPVVAMQNADTAYFFGIFAEIVTGLRARVDFSAHHTIGRGLLANSSLSLRDFLRIHLFWNSLTDWKNIRLQSSFCDRVGYRSPGWMAPWTEIACLLRAWRIWRGIKSKSELRALSLSGIDVGGLILDGYMRSKPSPVANLRDGYMLRAIWQACRDVVKTERYFSRHRPRLYLTSYTTYLLHGIPARMALKYGARVLSFGNYQELCKTVTADSVSHARAFERYAGAFARLPDPDKALALADEHLARRIGGTIDNAIGYMKNSAYEVRSRDVPPVKDALVLFTHDFYDSAHVYDWMVFYDMWDWLCFTIDFCAENGIPLFIKPHPNQMPDSSADFRKLCWIYPDLKLVSPDITNRQLVEAGMSCAVTVRGSVAGEMAYMGVPSISAGNNPHVSFDQFNTPRIRDEYCRMLLNHRSLPRDAAALKNQACAFYYMHNLNQTADERALRDAHNRWCTQLGLEDNGDLYSFEDLRDAFGQIRANPAFQSLLDDLAQTVAA